MNARNIIPWTKKRDEVTRVKNDVSPFFSLHREMNRLFDDFFRDWEMPMRFGSSWPTVEVNDGGDTLEVVAEIPGLDKDDVEVTLRDGVLTLRGEKKLERDRRLYSERWEGAFYREIPVGDDVDADKAKASFKNGVLTVEMSKKPEAQRKVKRIPVN
jgi:HSP20 family protein